MCGRNNYEIKGENNSSTKGDRVRPLSNWRLGGPYHLQTIPVLLALA